jgi:hypothetical protein
MLRQVPAVQRKSQNQVHATSMPDAAWPVKQVPARLFPEQHQLSGFDIVFALSTLERWFTAVRLLDSYLMLYSTFSVTLTTFPL